MNWYLEVLKKYAVFEGRAPRIEYWMFALFNIIICIVLSIIAKILGTRGILVPLYTLAVLLPSIGVSIRRIHDIGKSGWWVLINLVPVVGGIVFFIFTVLPSQPESNQYGPVPN